MQRILKEIKSNPFLYLVIGLVLLAVILGALSWLLSPVINSLSQQGGSGEVVTGPLTEVEAERQNSLDKREGLEIETTNSPAVSANLIGLRSLLPLSGSGFTLTSNNDRVVINYTSDTGLTAALLYLKGYGILGDNPVLVFEPSF